LRRAFLTIFFVAAVGAVSACGALVFWALQSLPPEEGGFVVPGLSADVRIYRDTDGIPYVFAENRRDAAAGLGFVHAQDRLWQMEAMRRMGHGRLAEVVGPAGLASDRLMRTLGISDLARRQLAILTPETRELLGGYSSGVNAWIGRHRGALPPEFILLGFEPEPWQEADSLVWARIMAMRLSGNWRDELLRARMTSQLTNEQLLTLWYPDGTERGGGLETLGAAAPEVLNALPLTELAGLFPAPPSQPVGASNAWAMQGNDGALLANDPHLGFSLPVLWYLARVATPYATLSGATVPGVPFHILGQNRDIAWGMTTTQSDQQDVFIERLSPDGQSYQAADGSWQPIQAREEIIPVARQPDERLVVRSTGHGPIVSDLVEPVPGVVGDGFALSLQAVYLRDDDKTADALFRMNRASDWPEFRAALRDFHSPQQNIVYADRAGNIGFLAPGRVPIRKAGRGRMPTPGWTSGGEWTGWVPFDELPVALNPIRQRLVSANNQIVSSDYPYFLTDDWAPNYRAQRIFELMDGLASPTVEGFASMQLDTVSTMARDLLPLLSSLAPDDPRVARAVDRLARWDGSMDRDMAEPLIFYAWLNAFQRAVLSDELGPLYGQSGGLRPRFLHRVLSGASEADAAWCDNVSTTRTETCDELLETSLAEVLIEISHDDVAADGGAYWGEHHPATFRNPVLASVPLIGDALGLRRVPASGGNYTINRAGMRTGEPAEPFADIHGPGYRAIYDLSAPGNSRFMIATGQSGNPFSVHYADLMTDWRDGGYRAIDKTQDDFETAGVAPMVLVPETATRPAPPVHTPFIDRLMLGFVGLFQALGGLFSGA